jgi:formylglycine-generating enzyme required for sulfatase activity
VVGVDFYDAWAYARWTGKRLPTGDEWEMAARSATGWLYPWGDEFEAGRCVSRESGASAPAAADSFPEGRSPHGVLHMAGNVMEWTTEGKGEAPAGARVQRGGSWRSPCRIYGITYVKAVVALPTSRDAETGFRCAADAR